MIEIITTIIKELNLSIYLYIATVITFGTNLLVFFHKQMKIAEWERYFKDTYYKFVCNKCGITKEVRIKMNGKIVCKKCNEELGEVHL